MSTEKLQAVLREALKLWEVHPKFKIMLELLHFYVVAKAGNTLVPRELLWEVHPKLNFMLELVHSYVVVKAGETLVPRDLFWEVHPKLRYHGSS